MVSTIIFVGYQRVLLCFSNAVGRKGITVLTPAVIATSVILTLLVLAVIILSIVGTVVLINVRGKARARVSSEGNTYQRENSYHGVSVCVVLRI